MNAPVVSWLFSVIQSNEFISALTGAVVGGVAVLGGTWMAACFDRRKRREENQLLLQCTLEAIASELDALFDRYQISMGYVISKLPSNSTVDYYYSVTENYITVFDNNAKLLGHLKNKSLRSAIIRTYIDIKSFIDGFKTNNTLYADYEALLLYDVEGAPSIIKARLLNLDIIRKDYGNKLKQMHITLNNQIPELVSRITNTIKSKAF